MTQKNHNYQAVPPFQREADYPGMTAGEAMIEPHKHVTLLLPDTGTEHWRRTAKEIGHALKHSGWKLDVQEHYGCAWRFRKQIRHLSASKYSGALISATPELLNSDARLGSLIESYFPVTFIGNGLDRIACCSVDDGDFAGGCLGVRHLIEKRFKRIALIGCESHNGEAFVNGCRQAFRECGLEPAAIDFADDEKQALMLLQSWLGHIDAVFYQQSEHGQKAFDFMQSKHIKIGSEIGVITFDDTLFRRLTIPSPTIIRRYPERLGQRAAKMLLGQIALPLEQRNYIHRIGAEVVLEAGHSTGEKAGEIYLVQNPAGGRRRKRNGYDYYHRKRY